MTSGELIDTFIKIMASTSVGGLVAVIAMYYDYKGHKKEYAAKIKDIEAEMARAQKRVENAVKAIESELEKVQKHIETTDATLGNIETLLARIEEKQTAHNNMDELQFGQILDSLKRIERSN